MSTKFVTRIGRIADGTVSGFAVWADVEVQGDIVRYSTNRLRRTDHPNLSPNCRPLQLIGNVWECYEIYE